MNEEKYPCACAECGELYDNMDKACVKCGSFCVVLVSVLEKHFGKDWRKCLELQNKE